MVQWRRGDSAPMGLAGELHVWMTVAAGWLPSPLQLPFQLQTLVGF